MKSTVNPSTTALRNLYFVRTAFQVIWAVSVVATVRIQPAAAAILLLLYPLWDVACTAYDLSTASAYGSTRVSQTINAVLGVLAAIGIGLTVFHQPIYAVAVFGAWALGAGLLQLIAGLVRRKEQLGGQWAMILSGTQSTLAGVAFLLGGLADKRHIKDVAGYAIFGAIYFLVGGILLSRRLAKRSAAEPNYQM